jgi:hypothetical protein
MGVMGDETNTAAERRLCYIAAPYADPSPEVRAWHVARACLLARLAVNTGWAPIVVHPGIAPIYGAEETEELRAVGLDVDITLLLHVRRAGGSLWLLLRDDLTMSSGVAAERRAWWDSPSAGRELVLDWAGWQAPMWKAGLGQRWAALQGRP